MGHSTLSRSATQAPRRHVRKARISGLPTTRTTADANLGFCRQGPAMAVKLDGQGQDMDIGERVDRVAVSGS
jgi:hypothetical protein